jgi:thioredoxin 1
MSFNTTINTNEHSIDRVLRAGLPVLLVFWRRENCAPCEQLNPVLERLASTYAGQLLIAKVEVSENPALPGRYDIAQLPALVMLRDGRVEARATGASPETALAAWIRDVLRGAQAPAPSGPSIPATGQRPEPRGAPPSPGTAGKPAQPRPATGDDHPIVLTDGNFDQVVGRSEQPVLVDFWAPWCGPCRMVAPAVEGLAREFAGRAIVGKLNVDENPRTSQRFGITSIPALYVFKGGKVVERLVGAQPASVLRQALARNV